MPRQSKRSQLKLRRLKRWAEKVESRIRREAYTETTYAAFGSFDSKKARAVLLDEIQKRDADNA